MKFIQNIDKEHAQDFPCLGATFALCSHREKLPRQAGVNRYYTTGNPPLKVAPEERKTHVNSYRRQTVHQSKFDPGVSELPRNHVNRPLGVI